MHRVDLRSELHYDGIVPEPMKSTYDVILVLPYPFADHPSFPEALLAAALKQEGFRVGILDVPHWQDEREFLRLGRPELFFAIVPGPVDSLIMNYTPTLKRRREDLYQIHGGAYFPDSPPSAASRIRPDRCVITFANQIRKAWKDVMVIAGGMETSERIYAHYDLLQQRIRRSILLDARLDLAVAGMGELQICAVARGVAAGIPIGEMGIPGTAMIQSRKPPEADFEELPAFDELTDHPAQLLRAYAVQRSAAAAARGTCQRHNDRWVVRLPDAVYSGKDLDSIYNREYRRAHIGNQTMSPALTMNLFSITSHRGCLGRCAFCAVCRIQGGKVVSRSVESVLQEVDQISHHPRWQGVVADVGGATAEMYGMNSFKSPAGTAYLELLRRIRRHPAVRKVFTASGVRHDLMLKNPELLEEIMRFHSGSFLRVAPEHIHDEVLHYMGKPPFQVFRDFCALFADINRGLKRRVDLAAYIIIGHPGEEKRHIRDAGRVLRNLGVSRVDAQIFTPAPGLLSTALFAAGMDERGNPVAVCRDKHELERRKAGIYARSGSVEPA